MIKVFITDDHQLVIDGVKSILEESEDIEVVGEALSGEATLERLNKVEVDVLLLDLRMPNGMGGMEVAKELLSRENPIKILVLTMYNEPQVTKQLLEIGVLGCLLKNSGKKDMLNAIHKVNKGERHFDSEVTNTLFDSIDKSKKAAEKVELTNREREVLKLIANELTTNEIADKLFISTHTVETHRKNLLSKLNVKNIAGLVRFAVKNHLD